MSSSLRLCPMDHTLPKGATSSVAMMRLFWLTQARGTITRQARESAFVSDPMPGTKGREPAGRGLTCVGFGAIESESDWACTDQ